MDVQNIRSKRGTVKVFHSLIKNTTFQTGMNGNYLQVFTVHVFINFYHLVTKRRSFTILPCRISPLSLIFASQKFCQILDFMGKSLFGSSYRASDTGLYKQLVPIQLQNSGIAGGFHQIFYGTTHFLNTKWHVHQIKKHFFLAGGMKNLCIHIPCFCYLNCNSIICTSVFCPEILLHFLCKGSDLRNFFRKHKKNRFAFFGNNVVLLTTF